MDSAWPEAYSVEKFRLGDETLREKMLDDVLTEVKLGNVTLLGTLKRFLEIRDEDRTSSWERNQAQAILGDFEGDG